MLYQIRKKINKIIKKQQNYLGVRHFGNPYNWVSCASMRVPCVSKVFWVIQYSSKSWTKNWPAVQDVLKLFFQWSNRKNYCIYSVTFYYINEKKVRIKIVILLTKLVPSVLSSHTPVKKHGDRRWRKSKGRKRYSSRLGRYLYHEVWREISRRGDGLWLCYKVYRHKYPWYLNIHL